MASLIPGYNYDIFISYRQKDNKYDGWVTEFVDNLKKELEATFKDEISVYFDINPHDGLLETHDVDASLKEKLKCLVFIPIISRTYCDPKSFAWEHEFKAFVEQTSKDQFGLKVKLPGGNVASRILPILIHDLDQDDIKLCESVLGGVLRGIEFIYKEPGVNKPLTSDDDEKKNLNSTKYRIQINKVANAIDEIISGLKAEPIPVVKEKTQERVTFDEAVLEEKKTEFKKPTITAKNKLLSTLAIIAILIVAGILLYPKIFRRDKFEEIRDADGRISIAVMPFENLTGDTTLNWFQRGISSLIINGLGGSSELAVRDDQTMFEALEGMDQVFTAGISPSQAKKVAEKVRAETYISGSFQGIEGKYRILANLVDTKSGNIICTNKVDGDLKSSGYLNLTDSLCNEIKNYLEIKVLEQKADYDFREAYPESAEAYRYFIEGVNLILTSDYEPAIKTLKKALEIDSTFTFASFYIAFAYNFNNQFEQCKIWTQKAYNTKDRLPSKYQNWLEMWYACFVSKNQQDIIRYCNLLEKSGIESRLLWLDLGVTYYNFSEMYSKAVEAFEKVEEISQERGGDWKYDRYYISYCEALLLADKPKEAKRISEKGLQINPKNDWLIVYQGSSNVMLGDTITAQKNISEIRAAIKRDNEPKSVEEFAIGYMYLWAKDTIMAERHYRKAYNLNPESPGRILNLAEVLIRSGINIKEGLELSQNGLKKYPDNYFLLWMKGLALHKSGKHDEALKILKEVDGKATGYLKDLKRDIKEVEKAVDGQKNN